MAEVIPWYKTAIFYEVHVKTFYDATNDGIGDFEGLRQKLDYLQELGIDCIWLLPFYKSPLRDDGYDISDYYALNPNFGTLADFKNFLEEAHQRHMRVITDLVVNHTSDQHAWFQEARRDPHSAKGQYYVWNDNDQKYGGARIIFTDTERSNWTWDDEAKAYYWHRFFSHQPDLNFDNPAVQEELLNVMRYWMDMGIDGFRLDAVPYLFEREGTNCENLPETHAYLKKLRSEIDKHYNDKVLLAEANQWPVDVRPYFGEGDECQMAFNFPIMPRLYMAIKKEERTPIVDIMSRLPEIPANCQWGLFLRNHDELTLEMVTDEERAFMYEVYAPDPRHKINVGIRRRLAPLLDNDRRRIELLNSLLFSLPGSPILYYGDEIGMGDNVYLYDRNGVRTPMQWNANHNAGFSTVDSAQLYSPVIEDPVFGYKWVNVEAQQHDPSSLLNWVKQLIKLRKQYPVFGLGELEFLYPENKSVLAYIRRDKDTRILVVNNLSSARQSCELDLRRFAGSVPVDLIGEVAFPAIGDAPYSISAEPFGYYWLKL
ncbi:MAG: maltose alpha-D-glucosyltransferase [Chloroflexi bacterium]|uniref:maltose alpha-D-glucosyltransferase n=1 Tax=Candidatus Chlorohelix allophototropha TaxID=3003348 RepID=A0A8T7M8Z5_9CHLR|nr:maltose alpha-D-glucosyltransferase [Chloroflexota bacterium]WJW68567.1 maltose alpha-D-glucosyltransferase [Chloroflexota bacterium L227-S17]